MLNFNRDVQKYICRSCNTSFSSHEQVKNIQLRDAIRRIVTKLIVTLRFGEGMSVRGISKTIKNVFGTYGSQGFIDKVCQNVSKKATEKMKMLNRCCQNKAKVVMFDETFPRTAQKGCVNLGVATCENGLIRKVGVIDTDKKSQSINKFFKSLITHFYNPDFFISDYDTTYPIEIKKVVPNIKILKDFVHTIRQIYRDGKSAINKITVKLAPSITLTKEKQKQIRDLKKKLLRKQLYKVLRRIIKGFKSGNCTVGTIYIEGGLAELNELSGKFSSLKPLYDKLNKFVKKYIETWNMQMELYSKDNIPLTSNIIESKNSIFKAFSKKAKSYSDKCLEEYFCGVALYENFDIKTRGINKGTNAMMRAGIDLNEFGAENFFEAVGISTMLQNEDLSVLVSKAESCISAA